MTLAVDTSTISAYFMNHAGADIEKLELQLKKRQLVVPPIVLVEALSNYRTRDVIYEIISGWRVLELHEDFWLRASELRAKVLKAGLRAKMADTLIAQCCIDHKVPLITRDADFKHYAKYGKLKLA